MHKILYIHIGAPKTGTSSVQDFLLHNEKKMAEEYELSFPIFDTTDFRISANGKALCDPESISQTIEKVRELPAGKVVLSEELIFLGGKVRNLAGLQPKDISIKIIAYLRNAPDYLASLWGEFNKYKNRVFPVGLDEYLATDGYLSDLGTLRQAMAKAEHIEFIVRPYDRSHLLNRDVVDDFLKAVGAEKASDLPRPDSSNLSRGRVWSDLMQELFQYDFIRDGTIETDAFEAECGRTIRSLSGDDRSIVETIDDTTIEEVAERHRAALDDIMSSAGVTDFQHFPRCYRQQRSRYRPLRAARRSLRGWLDPKRDRRTIVSDLADRLRKQTHADLQP